MSIYFPEALTVKGNTKIAFVTTVADSTAPKIATEVKAASSVEATLALRSWDPTVNVNTGSAPPRLGTTEVLPEEGSANLQVVPIAYPYNPTADDTDPNNKLKALLAQGAVVFAVVRKGGNVNTDWTVGDRVEVWKVRAGYQDEGQSGDAQDDFAEYEVKQNLVPVVTKTIGVLAA